jgi:hypothetical protein
MRLVGGQRGFLLEDDAVFLGELQGGKLPM